jgi:hypothetical protein
MATKKGKSTKKTVSKKGSKKTTATKKKGKDSKAFGSVGGNADW